MRSRLFYAFVVLLFNTYSGLSQTAILPIDIPVLFSGNFGELRSNHFHSGLDFKTQGRIGIPVKSVKDGYVSRINVSPYGYGRALYVDHPDGTTTVYAHLDHFSKEIEACTVDSQYSKQSFRVDMAIAPGVFPVKQGEIIAYSGNTGGSGGPHLHFELRDTRTEEAHDPLTLYYDKIQDTRKPEVSSFMLYPQQGRGVVNGKISKLALSFKKDKKGNTTLIPSTATVWGEVGFAVKAYDYMNGAPNILGVREIILKVDEQTVFHSDLTHFAFSDSRYINSFVDWEEWVYKKSFYMKSFVEPGNKLKIYRSSGDGFVNFNEEREYKIEYTLKDLQGNTASHTFRVKGVKQEIPAYQPKGLVWVYNQDNQFNQEGVSFSVPKGNLYTDIDFVFQVNRSAGSSFSALFKVGERAPLHQYCPLVLPVYNDTFPQKDKYGIISVASSGKKNWIGGSYEEGKVKASIRELGSFSIEIDTLAPKIVALNQANWTKNRALSFKITDNLSGIESWTASIDGQFILFEYDAKKAHLFCRYDAKRMKAGKGNLRLEVKDGCNNVAVFEGIINW